MEIKDKPVTLESLKIAYNANREAIQASNNNISEHNVSDTSHNDIRLLIDGLTARLTAIADSDDETLDQMSELIAYIKSNKSLIDSITTDKINVADIIDNLTTNVSNRPLSAKQGVVLKALIDAITIPTLLSQLSEDSTHRLVTDAEKESWNNKSNFSGKYSDLSDIPSFTLKLHTDGLVYVFIDGTPTGNGISIGDITTDNVSTLDEAKTYLGI